MPRLIQSLMMPATILLAGALCYAVALFSVDRIEAHNGDTVRAALAQKGLGWAEARPDGMLVRLFGTAPDEAARFHALAAAGSVIEAANVIDEIAVTPPNPVDAPRFSVELLRNDAGISAIGLIPATTERDALAARLTRITGTPGMADTLESADHPAPEGWDGAFEFGLRALELLERSKISISARRVAVTAVSDSPEEKIRLEGELRAAAPEGLALALDISAPRPIIVPFTLRFRLDEEGARFDACAADTEAATATILDAARRAGMVTNAECTLGLGAPAASWGQAVARGIDAVGALGGGTLTVSDTDMTLVALPGTDAQRFERAAADLEADLPEVFTLHRVLPDPVRVDGSGGEDGPREFVATLSPEGLLQLRGRIPDALVQEAAESYARARFGPDRVHSALRVDPDLPEGWPLRVLAGLEALSQLRNGSVIVQSDYLQLSGLTMDQTARARVTRRLSEQLGSAQDFDVDITYREPPATEVARHGGPPPPEACVAEIDGILAEEKITFAPGSTDVEGAAIGVVDRIADVLRACPDARIEIGGHTDSQGREEMNLDLSQRRADAVLTALIARRVLIANLSARGYGESRPIADNGTEDGREANRRIEFQLLAEAGEDAGTDGAGEATGGGGDEETPDGAAAATAEGAEASVEAGATEPETTGEGEEDGQE